MGNTFITVLDMSLTASYLILAVLAVRCIIKRVPARFLCLLWGAAGLRLVLPWKWESSYSLIPKASVVAPDIVMDSNPAIHSGVPVVDSMVNPLLAGSAPDPAGSINPLQVYSFLASIVWLTGIFILAAAALISYIRLRRRVRTAVSDGGRVWICETIDTPFILGIFRPRIYLPADMEEGRDAVIAHEKAHLKRFDYLTKPLAYAVLMIHWFNPLVWAAFWSFCKDVENACDQKVIETMSKEQRKGYARTLLDCSAKGSGLIMNPLAFGEVGVKSRIEEVLRFIRPSKKYLVFAASLCIMVCVFFAASPKTFDQYQFDGKSLDQMVSAALTSNDSPDELKAEGHKIIGTEEKDDLLFVYTIAATSGYRFINDKFINTNTTGPARMVLTFNPGDGHHIDTTFENFPARMKLKSFLPVWNLGSQQEEYAKAYLKSIGREAVIGRQYDEDIINLPYEAGISQEVNKALMADYPQYSFINKKPEYLEKGVRYVQEVNMESQNLLILKTCRYNDGTIVEKIVIRIDGNHYKEESVYRAKEANL